MIGIGDFEICLLGRTPGRLQNRHAWAKTKTNTDNFPHLPSRKPSQ